MATYQYKPLPLHHIRLIQLLPDGNELAPIRVQLLVYPIIGRKIGCHLYDALSYVWGLPLSTCEVEIVEGTNHSVLLVRENCHAALVRLRDPVLPRFVWVDSICINQEDNAEKAIQVGMMTKIYALASRVVVWLREPGEESVGGTGSRALEYINNATVDHVQDKQGTARASSSYRVQAEQDRDDISLFMQRSWFRRIWVLQEIAAARQVVIMDGQDEMDGFAFSRGVQFLGIGSDSFAVSNRCKRRIQMAANLIGGAGSRSRMVKPSDITSDQFTLGVHSFLELVDMFHDHDATDRRDKVFALLGMSLDIPGGVQANYDLTWGQVFFELTQSLIPGSQVVAHQHVEVSENHEIAFIRTKICVLGRVGRMGEGQQLNGMQQGFIKPVCASGRDEFFETGAAATIQQDDVVCRFPGTRFRAIIRPIYLRHDTKSSVKSNPLYFAIIVAALHPSRTHAVEEYDTGDDENQEGTGVAEDSSLAWIDCRLVWDWEMFREETCLESSQSQSNLWEAGVNKRIPLHLELMVLQSVSAWTPPEPFWDLTSRLENFGNVLGWAGLHKAANAVLGPLQDTYEETLGWNNPEFLTALHRIRQIYLNSPYATQAYQSLDGPHFHAHEVLCKIEALKHLGQPNKITETILLNIENLSPVIPGDSTGRSFECWKTRIESTQNLRQLCRYRTKEVGREITQNILYRTADGWNRGSRFVLGCLLDCLGPQDLHMVARLLSSLYVRAPSYTPNGRNHTPLHARLFVSWKLECIAGRVDADTIRNFNALAPKLHDAFGTFLSLDVYFSLTEVGFLLRALQPRISARTKQLLFTNAAGIAGRYGLKQMDLFLKYWGGEVIPTEEVMVNAASSSGDRHSRRSLRAPEPKRSIIGSLLDRFTVEKVTVTVKVLIRLAPNIAGRQAPQLLAVFESLADRLANQTNVVASESRAVTVSDEDLKKLVYAAQLNNNFKLQILETLRDKFNAEAREAIPGAFKFPPILSKERETWCPTEQSFFGLEGVFGKRRGKDWQEKALKDIDRWKRGEILWKEVVSNVNTHAGPQLY